MAASAFKQATKWRICRQRGGILLWLAAVFAWLLVPASPMARELGRGLLPRLETREGAPVHIEADSLTYDQKADQYVAEGHVVITREGMTLRADRVVLDNKTRIARADGHVEVVQKEDRLQSESLEINIDDRTGRVTNGTLFFEKYNLTVTGDEIMRLREDRYRIVGATLTTCNGRNPDWRFTAREIDLTVEGYARIRHTTFDVRRVPVIYLPYMIFPAKTRRQTGFLAPEYRSSSRIGHSLSLPFYWAFHESYDATFTQTYFTKRGYQQGVELRFAPEEWLEGAVHGEYIRDWEDPDPSETYRGQKARTNRDRWRLRMEQEADLPWGIVSRTHADLVSDNYYLEDLSPSYHERSLTYLTSTVNATKPGKTTLLAGELEYYRDLDAPGDDNGRTLQRLPSLLFHRTRLPVWNLPASLGMDASLEHFWREEGSRAELLALSPSVSLPLHLGPYFSLVPFARWTERYLFTQDDPEDGEPVRYGGYRYGASISTELARTYPVGEGWLKSLKHTLQPQLQIESIGHSSNEDFDEAFMRPVRHDGLVTAKLTQFLTGKILGRKEDLRFREFGRLEIVQSYSLREQTRDLRGPADEREPLRPLMADLELNLLGQPGERRSRLLERGPWRVPRQQLFLRFQSAYDWYDQRFEDLSATIRVGDSRGDRFGLSYRWLRKAGVRDIWRKQIDANLNLRVLPTLDLTGHARYAQERDQWIRYGYGLEFHPSCWAVRFSHVIEPGFAEQETNHEIHVKIFLLGLGPVLGR